MTGVAAEVGSTANNYQILARLASGGMAEIFLARGTSNTGVERYCVLKRILRERANDVQFVRMFLDEARLAAQLQHPNVAQVYDIGKLGDSYFFTMEYVHGETVRSILHRARSLRRDVPMNAVMSIAAGAAAGLHHAHERLGHDGRPLGIVHRDVSPSNLMVSYEGNVKVVDFGVAKAENRATETRSGTVKGKISYLSPEQCRGGDVDRRSDLFSLGIVFWEMLAMERLFKRSSDFENMTAIVNEQTPPPSSRRPGVTPELDRISLKLLAKDPAARFQSADELVETLEEAAAKSGAMISASSLGRFLREMFGQRPEPWLELSDAATHEVPVEGVTVTSEPVPSELHLPQVASVDLQLAHVRDLRREPVPTDPPMTMPQSGPVASARITTPATPAARVNLPLPAPPPSVVSAPAYALPASSGHSFPPLDSSSGSYPYHSGSQSAFSLPAAPALGRSRNWMLIAIVAMAAILGSLTVWLAMRGGGSDARAADAAIVAATPIDAEAAIELEPDAAPAAAPADAYVALADAAVEMPTPDAAVQPPVDELADFMARGRWGDAVALCTKKLAANDAATCTMAACAARSESKARQWFAKVTGSATKRQVTQQCRANGIEVVPKPIIRPPTPRDAGVNPCIANPQDCQGP